MKQLHENKAGGQPRKENSFSSNDSKTPTVQTPDDSGQILAQKRSLQGFNSMEGGAAGSADDAKRPKLLPDVNSPSQESEEESDDSDYERVESDNDASDTTESDEDDGDETVSEASESSNEDPEEPAGQPSRPDLTKELSSMSFEKLLQMRNQVGMKAYEQMTSKKRPTDVTKTKKRPCLSKNSMEIRHLKGSRPRLEAHSSCHMDDNRPTTSKAKAKTSHKRSSTAPDNHLSRCQKALEKQFDKAQKASMHQASTSAAVSSPSPSKERRDFSLDALPEPPALQATCLEDTVAPFDCFPTTGESAEEPSSTPMTSAPTSQAEGLCPPAAPSSGVTQEMCNYLSEVIIQGIKAAFPSDPTPASKHNPTAKDQLGLQEHNCSCRSITNDCYLSGEEEVDEVGFSEDEDLEPSKPTFAGLFNPSRFKTILHKAKSVTNMGWAEGSVPPRTIPIEWMFTGPPADLHCIPSPPLFRDTIQDQWSEPGSVTSPSGSDWRLYNVAPELEKLLQWPKIDDPVAALTSPSIVPASDYMESLNLEDKKAEASFRKTHLACAWAIRAATAASFFNRASLIWLRQILDRIPPEDSRLRWDINKLVTATEYSADATLDAAKFASRALASNVTSRRIACLRHWEADMLSKWHLASAPFKGGNLFGDALDPVLIENKYKKKVLPSSNRRVDRRSSPYARRQRFQSADTGFPDGNGANRPQHRRSFRNRDRQ
ncbi:PREDICTED: ribosomal RNA processing protein 36 homolog isoform X1 [Thamnophis sirtalis]|uniref:Ribosomal RNA processing protein 36 homolog isoform X1 n=1 Tax=Thamnophis sirtalis TaxID=35019 RepID=A0A6I9X0G1_9SAUR|nr:PREDICTED: ribosomal RNA processing protein 36 homolog isoform X1 [Thamnophis sirtalis]